MDRHRLQRQGAHLLRQPTARPGRHPQPQRDAPPLALGRNLCRCGHREAGGRRDHAWRPSHPSPPARRIDSRLRCREMRRPLAPAAQGGVRVSHQGCAPQRRDSGDCTATLRSHGASARGEFLRCPHRHRPQRRDSSRSWPSHRWAAASMRLCQQGALQPHPSSHLPSPAPDWRWPAQGWSQMLAHASQPSRGPCVCPCSLAARDDRSLGPIEQWRTAYSRVKDNSFL
mmetsp:Transcript_1335/g.3244  ORF Transcript_1335/g.3244 Transcript_1335/m.3244 type:complete len:228 (+) Transcript_1335:258-941(+)